MMKHGLVRKSQLLAQVFLPVIVIGGLFFPLLGFLVPAMMAFFLGLSFFKGRYWCWNLCPRGSFLDASIAGLSLKKPLPKKLTLMRSRIFIITISFILSLGIWVFIPKDTAPEAIGAAFVSICLGTTIVSVILGICTRPRSWCIICPMGTLQGLIWRLSRKYRKV